MPLSYTSGNMKCCAACTVICERDAHSMPSRSTSYNTVAVRINLSFILAAQCNTATHTFLLEDNIFYFFSNTEEAIVQAGAGKSLYDKPKLKRT